MTPTAPIFHCALNAAPVEARYIVPSSLQDRSNTSQRATRQETINNSRQFF